MSRNALPMLQRGSKLTLELKGELSAMTINEDGSPINISLKQHSMMSDYKDVQPLAKIRSDFKQPSYVSRQDLLQPASNSTSPKSKSYAIDDGTSSQ